LQMQSRCALEEPDLITVTALKRLWKNNIPSKVSIFGWRLLLDKLTTREALYRKGVVTNNLERCCVLCFRENEDTHHVFINCSISVQVWQFIFKWMGTNLTLPIDVQRHFSLFGELSKGDKSNRYRHIIWLAMTWSIWRMQNNILFRGTCVNIPWLVD
jgi:hypothetical protein